MTVVSSNEETAKKYNVRGKGVVVTDMEPNGLGAVAGLNVGDVITAVNGKSVDSPEGFQAAMAKANLSDGVRMAVRGAGGMERLAFVAEAISM